MTGLLIRWFVKNDKDIQNPAVRERYGKLAGAVGVVSNALLFLLKFLAGFFFQSISVMADAVNNLSDAGSSVITLVGFKISGKPADAQHPYGHARMEYITGLAVSFIILLLGLQLVQSSAEKIFHPEETVFSWLTVGALAVSIIIKLWQGLFNRKIGKRIASAALEATAADSLNDVIATAVVLVSVIISRLTGWRLDGYMGVAVAVFIIISGIRLIRDTVNPLLGMAPDRELVKKISDKIHSYEGVLGLHDLAVHNYGPGRCFASVHVEVPASQDILISHDIIDNIERDFMDEMGIHLVIHLDPVVTDDETTNALHQEVNELVRRISPELSVHDFRVVVGNSHTNLIFDVAAPYGLKMSNAELKHLICEKVQQLDGNYYAVVVIDRNFDGS